jgi:tRNA (cytidine/uridine-2'-O-)-methyltransferase
MRIAFFQPDIPQNVGAAIRLAACFGTPLDIIEPCGFPLTAREIRRVSMDYGGLADVTRHGGFAAWQAAAEGARTVLMTTRGATPLWDFSFRPDDRILMGRESAGVPDAVHDSADARIVIPMAEGARSLNVVISAGIALAEAIRQTRR